MKERQDQTEGHSTIFNGGVGGSGTGGAGLGRPDALAAGAPLSYLRSTPYLPRYLTKAARSAGVDTSLQNTYLILRTCKVRSTYLQT